MTSFPPLADRPDDVDAILEENDAQASPAVLDVLGVASKRGLDLDEYLQLASICVSVVNRELCEMIEQDMGTEDSAHSAIEYAALLGKLQIAEDIINYFVDLSEDEEAGEDD
jgi:hypothetical protein